jgi:hypothetical protein
MFWMQASLIFSHVLQHQLIIKRWLPLIGGIPFPWGGAWQSEDHAKASEKGDLL